MTSLEAMQWFQNIARRHRQGADGQELLDDCSEQLSQWKARGELDGLIRQMLALTGLGRLLPDQYASFQPVVMEGMAFVLAQLPLKRLARKILDQAALDVNCPSGVRICTLINDMPSLQKLGQILARNPGLDAEFRRALTDLEDNIRSATYADLQPGIRAAVALSPDYQIEPETDLLAQATVCAVVGATVQEPAESRPTEAVLKMVKPAVRKNLALELAILDALARFLDDNAQRWELGEFRFQGTFDQVRQCLTNEVDLVVEQDNLKAAGDYFRDHGQLRVPRPLPGSTADMTVMSREEGFKITSVTHLDHGQRRALAMSVARTLILEPITSLAPVSIFHGDPHAGNIAYEFKDGQPRLILYDWGMMGQLQPMERLSLVLMALGAAAQSTAVIVLAADLIARGKLLADGKLYKTVTRSIERMLMARGHRFADIVAVLEKVFEILTRHGIALPVSLLMFKKAQVTLRGVLADIDPSFKCDEYLVWAAAATFVRDFSHLRYQRMVMSAVWDISRHSLGRMLRLQKQLLALFRETSYWLLKMPFEFLDAGLLPAPQAYAAIEAHPPTATQRRRYHRK